MGLICTLAPDIEYIEVTGTNFFFFFFKQWESDICTLVHDVNYGTYSLYTHGFHAYSHMQYLSEYV